MRYELFPINAISEVFALDSFRKDMLTGCRKGDSNAEKLRSDL